MTGLIGSVLVITPIAAALAQPQAAACATINYRGLEEVAPGILASSAFDWATGLSKHMKSRETSPSLDVPIPRAFNAHAAA